MVSLRMTMRPTTTMMISTTVVPIHPRKLHLSGIWSKRQDTSRRGCRHAIHSASPKLEEKFFREPAKSSSAINILANGFKDTSCSDLSLKFRGRFSLLWTKLPASHSGAVGKALRHHRSISVSNVYQYLGILGTVDTLTGLFRG